MNFLQFSFAILCIVPYTLTQRFGRHQVAYQTAYQDVQTMCQTPLDKIGECVSLAHCPEVLTLYRQLEQNRATQYSKELQRRCGNRITRDKYPIVCCTKSIEPQFIPHTESITERSATTENIRTTPSTTTTENFEKILGSPQCRSPNEEIGYCQPLSECSELVKRLREDPTNENFRTYLRNSRQICGSTDTTVCCPLILLPNNNNNNNPNSNRVNRLSNGNAPHQLPTEDDGCGVSHQSLSKIVGGEDSQPGAWPWIALIGYNPREPDPFKCGGTLITARHVLTAAHCLQYEPHFVRLGEYDLGIETETRHIDVDVTRSVKHPDFGTTDRRHDLAVLYLVRNVQFTDDISPICLPQANDLITKSYTGYNPFVAGWGRTTHAGQSANILQQVQITVHANSLCQRVYTQNRAIKSNEQFDSSVICAGVLSGGKDSCRGDSGGPLMVPELYKGKNRYYIIGIVSYGIRCGEVGIPGVYTSTQHFMNWIKDRVAET